MRSPPCSRASSRRDPVPAPTAWSPGRCPARPMPTRCARRWAWAAIPASPPPPSASRCSLGVSPLARSGQTVFSTALVRNLVAGGRLPCFTAMAEGRITRAYLEPQPDDSVPRFSYEEHLGELARDPPQWPESTRRISQLRVTIEYTPATALRRALATGRLHVDIVDYPGEWLIDLPLLELSFSEWSRRAGADARAPQRSGAAKDRP